MKFLIYITALLSILTLSGCATVTSNAMQPLSVKTKSQSGTPVTQVKCSLKNEKGEWSVVTPNIVSVHKAAGNLAVNCKKSGLPDGNARAISRAGAGMYGNAIIGGGIGALIDHNTGKAYNYPDNINVIMGDSVTIDRRDPDVNNNQKADSDTVIHGNANDDPDAYHRS